MRVRVEADVAASRQHVWDRLARIEEHSRWMRDAVRIEFVSDRRRGAGTEIAVATKVGPFRTTDLMRFVEWEEPAAMGVHHRGLFTGVGRFTLDEVGEGTRLTWEETIRFPWVLGGPLGAALARPVLRRVWRSNLRRFAAGFNPR